MSSLELWTPLAVAFAAVTAALLLWVALTKTMCKTGRCRDLSRTVALVVFSTSYTFLFADLLVGVSLKQSHGFGFTLASQRWVATYWEPTINSYGYRDFEPSWKDRVLFMVGGSFPPGYGVDRLDDTMSAVLGKKLGSRWTVATIARAGWHSKRQLKAVADHPKSPDVIVVTHTHNDIIGAATARGHPMPQVVSAPAAYLKPIVDRSFLVNWLYWRGRTDAATAKFTAYLRDAYSAPEIFNDHIAELLEFVRFGEKIGARVYFVIWPTLADLAGSEDTVRPLSDALKGHGTEVIDVLPRLRGRPLKDLVVNPSDPHPNARVHADVAELIFQRLQQTGIH